MSALEDALGAGALRFSWWLPPCALIQDGDRVVTLFELCRRPLGRLVLAEFASLAFRGVGRILFRSWCGGWLVFAARTEWGTVEEVDRLVHCNLRFAGLFCFLYLLRVRT